ncbi:hypothetical protein MMC25_004180 [Agyrium rufum]|nr:hypothetical protein [Agyrium rufum]
MAEVDLSRNRDPYEFSDMAGIFGALGYNFEPERDNFRAYAAMVAAYSPRNFSFSSDAENAIIGVLGRIGRTEEVRYTFGLPEGDVKRALLWTESEDEELDKTLIRRQGFPSWSWLGWHGHIEYSCWLADPTPIQLPTIDFSDWKHHLVTPGLESPVDIVVPEYATLRFNSSTLEIESKIAQFKAVAIRQEYSLEGQDGGSDAMNHPIESTGRSEESKLIQNMRHAWQIVDRSGKEVSVGITYVKPLGTFLFLDSATSQRLTKVPDQMVELVFLQRWSELPEFNSDDRRCIGDRVWVMIILRNPDRTAERISLTTISQDSWEAADPLPSTIDVV